MVDIFGSHRALYDGDPHIVHVHDSSMLRTHDVFAVEFFAPWCGHCQAFSPTWKEVGRLSCGASPTLRIGVVDCVAHPKICQDFEVQAFPTIRVFREQAPWHGLPLQRCQHGCRAAAAVLSDILQLASSSKLPRQADALIAQSTRLGCGSKGGVSTADVHSSALGSVGGGGGGSSALKPGEPPAELFVLPRPMEDVASAVVYGLKHELLSRPNVPGSRRRTALTAWLTLLTEALPGERNRIAIRRVVEAALPKSQDATAWAQALHSLPSPWLPDGGDATNDVTWRACRGFSPAARGYPCALWSLFHTLLVHAPGPPAEALLAIEGYVEHFFGCAACVDHFLGMARKGVRAAEGEASLPPAPDGRNGPAARTLGEATLWLWRAHNAVNLRLNGTGEAAALRLGLAKVQWPDQRACPGCRRSTPPNTAHGPARRAAGYGAGAGAGAQWNESAVLQFLGEQYCHKELSPCPPLILTAQRPARSSAIVGTLVSTSAIAREHVEAAVDRAAAQTVSWLPPTLSVVVSALIFAAALAWAAWVACGCRGRFPLRHHRRTALRRYRAVNAIGRAAAQRRRGATGAAYDGIPASAGPSDFGATSSEDEYR